MWKKAILIALCFMLICIPEVYAAEPRLTVVPEPSLEFSGTTAICGFQINDVGQSIRVTMELWQNDTLVDSWTKTGTSSVTMSETCAVKRLRNYTLKVSGTSGGVSFGPVSVTKRCPLF